MPTLDPQFFGSVVTVASATYPSNPNVDASLRLSSGRWSFQSNGTIDIYVSFNGVDDALVLPAGSRFTFDSPTTPARVWMRGASATSTPVYCQFTGRSALGGI